MLAIWKPGHFQYKTRKGYPRLPRFPGFSASWVFHGESRMDLTLAKVYGGQLYPVDDVIVALGNETDVNKITDFTKRVEAAKVIDSRNGERRNYWSTLSIWSTRRLGEMLVMAKNEGTLSSGGRPEQRSHDATVNLKDIGIERDQSARAQKLAAIPEDKIKEFVERQQESEEEISKAGLMRFATGTEKAGAAAHVSKNTGIPEWYTPDDYLDAVRKSLGEIDLDPASSAIAQKRVKAKKYYTLSQDGLSKPWSGRIFLNPPYSSSLIGRFVSRLCEEYEGPNVSAAVLLVNNATETTWFQQAADLASAVCFPTGRIKFLDEQGNPGAPLQGQAILYFGRAEKRFRSTFDSFGFCAWIQ